jgi:hypothetical protein
MHNPEEPEGWVRSHFYQGSYRHTLAHEFGGNKTYFEIERNGYDSYGLNFYPDEKTKELMDDFREEHPRYEDPDREIADLCCLGIAGSRDAEKLKDLAEKNIAFFDNHFNKNQNATIDDIKKIIKAVAVTAAAKQKSSEKLQLNDATKQASPPIMDRGKNNNGKEKTMTSEKFNWDDNDELKLPEITIRVESSDSDPSVSVVEFYNDLEALVNDSPDEILNIPGSVETAKKLVENTINHISSVHKNLKNLYAEDFYKYLSEHIGSEQKTTVIESPEQGPSPSPAGRNNNGKEKTMSDESIAEKARDPKEEAFLNAVHQRKVIADALKAGTLSCLPGADGYADTAPAMNLVNGNRYHGANMLFLKEHQKQNGFPTAEYVTSQQIDQAKEENPALFIRKGQKGVSLYVSEQNEETGAWEDKQIRLFNVAQTSKPWDMKAWAEQKQQERAQERLDYLKPQYGENYERAEPSQKGPGPEITCKSTDPEKYLGQYLAAVSMGGKFKASPEQAAEFSQKMENSLFAKMENGHTNPFKLAQISRDAGQHCKEVIRDIRMEAQKLNQPEQKQEQQQSRGGRSI